MRTSEVCYVCGSRGASCVLYVLPQDSGVSYFSFLESHVPPRGARKPDSDGAVSACTVCSAFLNQQWDTFERTRTPLIKRLYWLKRIDNGAFTGAKMSVQGEYVAQLMGLHGGVSASSGGGSPFEYGNHAGISCGKPDLIASDDEESVASDSINGALDLTVSPRKLERQARKCGQTKVSSNLGVGIRKRSSNGVLSNIICYICRALCHHTLARFIYAFKSSCDEPHFPFLLDLSPPAGAMQLTKTGVTQVCAECRKTLTRQWRSYESRGLPETDRVYWINDVAYPERHKSLQHGLACDRRQKTATCISNDICYLCGQPDGATHWIATRTGCETEMVLPFVAQLKCPTGARPICADGRTRICSPCFIHIEKQWRKFDADSIPQEKRTFVLRPVAKTSSCVAAGVSNDVESKKILADCPVLATVLSAGSPSNSEIPNEHGHPQLPVLSHKLQSTSTSDSADVKTSVPVGLLNGTCTLTNGTATSTYCSVCGLDCGDVTVVGKQTGIHKLFISSVDALNASSHADTKGSLSLPFFPFLAHLPSQLHGKVTSLHEHNAIQSCTVCYVNLIRQWRTFEMSSGADEQRWQRQYTYQMISCDVCHGSVERQKMTVVAEEELTGMLQSPDISVDGLNLVCHQCCRSLLLSDMTVANKSSLDSKDSTKNAVTDDVVTENDAVTSDSHQRLSSAADSHQNESVSDSSCQRVDVTDDVSIQRHVTDGGNGAEVSKLPTENRSDDLTSLDDSSHAVSECTQSSEQMHVTCSKSPGAVAVSMSTPSQFMVVSSATTGGVCTTVGNLPQPFNSSISSPSRVTAASHGIGVDTVTASAVVWRPPLLQQQQASISAALRFPSYFDLSPLFNNFLPTNSLIGGFSGSSLLGNFSTSLSASLSTLPAENKSHRNNIDTTIDKESAEKKDDTLLRKQAETLRLVMDDDDKQLHEKPANNPANSRPTFYRPFLDIEDSSPPEKLCKLRNSEVPNGMCGLLPTLVQEMPLCSGNVTSSGNTAEDSSLCESNKLDNGRLCEGDCREVRDEDGGRDRRLNAALGLISLADVSSDGAQVQLTCSMGTTAGDCADENRSCISSSKTDAAAEDGEDASKPRASRSCDLEMPSHSKFVWPGVDAVIEAYASHVEELQLERQCLLEQQQKLELHHQELSAAAESLTTQLLAAESIQNELERELLRIRNAIDSLKNCLQPFLT